MSTPRAVRARWWALRGRVARIPLRVRLGVIAAIIASGGLIWQHDGHLGVSSGHDQQRHAASVPTPAPAGDYGDNPAVAQLSPPTVSPQDASTEAARAVAQRFATNFGSPNSNRDDWLTRIGGDVSEQLMAQYRLTDIRNVTQAAVVSVDGPIDDGPAAAAFRALYGDGSRVEIRLALSIDGWKVVNVLPLANSDVSAAPSPGTR